MREATGRAWALPALLTSPLPCPQRQHLAHLEEKLRLQAQARDEAQSACLQQRQTVAEAQARASQLGLQVEGLRRRLEELQQVAGTVPPRPPLPPPPRPPPHAHPHVWQELSNKDQEKVAEVTRVRVELREQNGRLQAELTAQEALKEKVAALERRLKGERSPSPAPAQQDPFSLVPRAGGLQSWAWPPGDPAQAPPGPSADLPIGWGRLHPEFLVLQ